MFVGRTEDIYVASYPRSGTTWVQMILYQVMTAGMMDFDHISDVIPFFERTLQAGQDFENKPSPRLFKTHLPVQQMAGRPGRYIYIERDGMDVLVSYFYFYRSYVDASISFSAFFDAFLAGRVQYGSWFRHVAGWRKLAAASNVLFLRYEELVSAFSHSVDRIAAFLGSSPSPEDRARIAAMCDFSSMRRHELKFRPETARTTEPVGNFIRNGKPGGWKEHFSEEQKLAFDKAAAAALKFREEIV